jgi:LytTr DNA-binding domain
MLSFLKAPYPLFKSPRFWLVFAFVSGVFVPSFLIFFKPFEISVSTSSLYLFGYGFVAAMAILIVSVVLPLVFSSIFIEEKWTVSKQIAWLALMLVLIAFFNQVYYAWYYNELFNAIDFFIFLKMVLSLGVFLIAGLTVSDYIRRLKNYQNSSAILNERIHDIKPQNTLSEFEICDENQKDKIKVSADDLLFIKADDNYIEIYYLQQNQIKKTVFRNTLKAVEALVLDAMFRCHRTYLVNLKQVNKISGNAQGYRLHFDKIEQTIPVSREKGREIRLAIDHL